MIGTSRLGSDGRPEPPRPALERPYHLSYPCVLAHEGEIFMVPETYGERRVELYRCRRFPDDWELDTVLLRDLSAADPTIVAHEGRLWMFVCVAPPGMSPGTELHLFHAERIRGPWHPHPQNPVVSDVRNARPAGRPWVEGGSLVRAAQDCSGRYGRGLTFHRITVLTPDRYADEAVGAIAPEGIPWYPRAEGTHTWNRSERSCATDVRVARFRGAEALRIRRNR